MKISVVIPLYNKELYIRRAMESVLRQNAMPDEIIVVDDGSTDSSMHEVTRISDPRIRLLRQANAGECAARNRGVVEARNDLIAFLDADDEWEPDFLSKIQELIASFPGCGAYATFYKVIAPSGDVEYSSPNGIPPYPWVGIISDLFKVLQAGLPFNASSIVLSKKVLEELGGFPEGIKRGGDLMLWVRLGMGHPIAYSSSRQAIYHTEALNRACTTFPSAGEGAHTRMISEMLKRGEVPASLMEDVADYCAQEQIGKARELIRSGRSRAARELLSKAESNHKYHRVWCWWYLWSLVPYPILQFADRLYRSKGLV